jgi:hypothetical protein
MTAPEHARPKASKAFGAGRPGTVGPMAVQFPCTVKRLMDGTWRAVSIGPVIGIVEAEGSNRPAVLDLMRDEIRFRVEFCPCSAVADDYVELVVTDAPATPARGSVF